MILELCTSYEDSIVSGRFESPRPVELYSKWELIFSMQFSFLAFNKFYRLYFLAIVLGLPLAFVYRSFCYKRNATIQVI